MSLWHADMNAAKFASGVDLTVFCPHRVVRVVTADQMSIEGPDGERMSAQVLDRTGDHITLVLADGTLKSLSMHADDSLARHRSDEVFSQQHWVVN
jgi:hypothetical protein